MDGLDRQEILTKAIEKAIKGGWGLYEKGDEEGYAKRISHQWIVKGYRNLIFNHDFAKALWGEEHQHVGHENTFHEYMTIPAWEWHMQMMVVADDPINYLGEHIGG